MILRRTSDAKHKALAMRLPNSLRTIKDRCHGVWRDCLAPRSKGLSAGQETALLPPGAAAAATCPAEQNRQSRTSKHSASIHVLQPRDYRVRYGTLPPTCCWPANSCWPAGQAIAKSFNSDRSDSACKCESRRPQRLLNYIIHESRSLSLIASHIHSLRFASFLVFCLSSCR